LLLLLLRLRCRSGLFSRPHVNHCLLWRLLLASIGQVTVHRLVVPAVVAALAGVVGLWRQERGHGGAGETGRAKVSQEEGMINRN
jgi:hypothetical protein